MASQGMVTRRGRMPYPASVSFSVTSKEASPTPARKGCRSAGHAVTAPTRGAPAGEARAATYPRTAVATT